MSRFTDKDFSEAFGRKFVTMDQVSPEFANMMGKILTVIDASIPNGSQCKALKDVIRDYIHDAENVLMASTDYQELPGAFEASDSQLYSSDMYGRWGDKTLVMRNLLKPGFKASGVTDLA